MVFTFTGQIHGGKNNMRITRNGIHYPDPKFEKWRTAQIYSLLTQKKNYINQLPIISDKYHWKFLYIPSDNRRRDVPAILDAVFHCLEKAGIVKDDCLIKNIYFKTNMPNKDNAGLLLVISDKKIS